MLAVETTDLRRCFGAFAAVEDLNLSIEEGTIFGLLGPNGAGKTTTIRMLTTLLSPTSGTARVAGFDIVKQASAVRRSIGYVPQMLSTDGTLTGWENLMLSAKLYHLPRDERQGRIDTALQTVGLTEARDKLVRQYSGGMIRRLEVAAAMLHRPRVLFLDEPTVGLDPVARDAVWDHIRQLPSENGTTILLTTHYMEEADQLCDHVAVMDHGRVAGLGSPAQLKAAVGPDATLDDVFASLAGGKLESGSGYGEVSRTRRNARRLG